MSQVHFVSFPAGSADTRVDHLVFNLVDPVADTGSVSQLISKSLEPLGSGDAALFNSDPLIDYRAQRPLMNFRNGHLVDMRREGIRLTHASDIEGQKFLHLRGAEPDFHWDALLADIMDVIEHYGVTSTYSFTAVAAPVPHTRPADMVVRQTAEDDGRPVLQADFWFPAAFADYVEYHLGELGITHTNVAVRVPMYLAGHQYSPGAAGALGLMSSISGLHFPLGDLEQEAAVEISALTEMIKQNDDLASLIARFEQEYDASGVAPGFVTAPRPELKVPSSDEIGRAAEQFLAGASNLGSGDEPNVFDPQGLLSRFERHRSKASSDGNSNKSEPGKSWWQQRRGKHSSDPEEG
ncbi:MAG: PAC2 family protein [Actinomycetaceae bacterium]|nr:PAC2 family protein [Actinomycetaceae bacterium]